MTCKLYFMIRVLPYVKNIHINLFKHSHGLSLCQKQRKENLALPKPIQMMLHTFCLPGRQHGPHPINLYL